MVYFALSLLSGTIIFFIYLVKTKRWKHLSYFLGFVVIFTGIFIYALKVRPYTVRGPEQIYQQVILFLSTAAGLITNPIYGKIKGSKSDERLRDLIDAKDFMKAVFVSPCIFVFIWGVLEKMAEANIITYCLAYTNSFFWETTVQRFKRELAQRFDKFLPITAHQIHGLPPKTQQLYIEALKVRKNPAAFAISLRKVLEKVCKDNGVNGDNLQVKIENLAAKVNNYRLTNQARNSLRQLKVPESILKGLKTIENQEFTKESEFLKAIKEQIGEEETTKHKTLILEHSAKTIRDLFTDMAHQLREVGNIAAHADEIELTPAEVPILDDLCRAILEYVYTTPALIKQVQARIDSLKTEKTQQKSNT